MVTLFSSEKLEELANVPQCNTGAPMPSLVADEHTLMVEYISGGNKKVKINFVHPSIHKFGLPNDEVLSGHPLYKHGLKYYAVYEVKNSSWIDQLEKINSVHPRHDKKAFIEGKHHYIFTFHDSTFECIAKGIEVIT